MSARYCGCDPEANWICEQHAALPRIKEDPMADDTPTPTDETPTEPTPSDPAPVGD